MSASGPGFADDALGAEPGNVQAPGAAQAPTPSQAPAPAQAAPGQAPQTAPSGLNVPRAGTVTAATPITGPAGALKGFPVIDGIDLNQPGPVNDVNTGACRNVQQIKFDLTGITPAEVDLIRTKNGVAGPVGSEQPRTGQDGPSEPTKLRGGSFIAVADDPGLASAGAKAFPIRYTVGFNLYAFDRVSKAVLASASYTVNIVKQSIGDSHPVNEFKNFNWKAR